MKKAASARLPLALAGAALLHNRYSSRSSNNYRFSYRSSNDYRFSSRTATALAPPLAYSARDFSGPTTNVRVMVSEGDTAPTFTATIGTSDHEDFDVEEHVGDGPVVLAFFPGAFTPPCTNEMVALQEDYERFEDAGATLLGVSADSPFALGAFREAEDLEFTLVSDTERKGIDLYGVETSVPELGLHGVANRAVYVIDEDGSVSYAWEADEPANEPDYDELFDAVESLSAPA